MSLDEVVGRFLLGGSCVALFAVAGAAFKPKTFAGLFGAAPTVALVSLSLAFDEHGSEYVGQISHAMILGALALLGYSAICLASIGRPHVSVLLASVLSWGAWGLLALALHRLLGAT
jgi:uncharacterized membrane protein (GlpM family)